MDIVVDFADNIGDSVIDTEQMHVHVHGHVHKVHEASWARAVKFLANCKTADKHRIIWTLSHGSCNSLGFTSARKALL